MTDTKTLPTLSQPTIDHLIYLRENNSDQFYALVASLRNNKWPLRAIADPLKVSRSIVSDWQKKAQQDQVLPVSEQLPPIVPKQVKSVYARYTLTEQQQNELRELAGTASRVRRYTDKNAPSRLAAQRLEELLHEHKENGASLSQLARACGVTRRAISQRLEKQ